MIRFDSTHFGMKESRNGKWVEYSLYLSERRELEEIASSRLDTIHERNSEISVLKKTAEEYYKNYQGIIDRINNEYNALDRFVKAQDNTIGNLVETNKKLKIESKFTDIKHDIFIFSVVLNLILVLTMVAYSFGGVH